MKTRKILTYITIILIVILSFTSCINENESTSGKITTEPTASATDETLSISEWQEYAEKTLPDYIEIEDLMQSPEYGTPRISKDGTKIFYRHITQYADNIEVLDRNTGKIQYVPWPNVRGIPYFYTTPDNNKVIILIDDSGDENYGLYLADIKEQEAEEIMPAGDFDCIFLGFDQSNDDECFIGVFDFTENVKNFHVYRFNIKKKTFKLIMSNPGNIEGWEFDSQGRLVMVQTSHEDASYKIWLRNDLDNDNNDFVESEWTNIITWEYEDADSSGIIGIDDASENILMLDSSISNLISVVNYNIETGEKTIISQDSQGIYDPSGMWLNPDSGEVMGVAYLRERLEWESLDEDFGKHLDVLKSVSDGEIQLLTSSKNDEYWIVSYSYDTKSDDYYVYSQEDMKADYLFTSNPAMGEYDFAPQEPISYETSDGLTIYGYATFPLNLERKDLPLVVLVHGGPWSRDTWGFDRDVQFLANRGYMVLQVNFRGSTGYGKDFMLAGDMEWGRKMHEDVLDGLDWAIKQGYADPDRVAIYGASYGGYEALVGAAFTPEKFACAIDLFGPSSLLTFVSSQPPQWSSYSQNLFRSIGDPATDSELMRERSPYYKATDISIPLMVVHGGNDVRVTQQESEQLVTAMRDAGIDVEYILFPDAGHGFSSYSQLETFYEACERFLAEHIGGRSRVDD